MTAKDFRWSNLRPLHGSVHLAFEELCCQLARHEDVATGSSFVRTGTKDGGVECYWVLPDGQEHAWQAKFFDSPPTPGQWKSVDQSVKRGLETHPSLSDVTICMPLNMSDPRLEGQESFKERWDKRVDKWSVWAKDKGKSVRFHYWGEHEILSRLTLRDHRGRYFYWFNREYLDQAWFEKQFAVVREDVGPKYSNLLNVETPTGELFESLGRARAVVQEVIRHASEVRSACSLFDRAHHQAHPTPIALRARSALYPILNFAGAADAGRPWSVDWDALRGSATEALSLLRQHAEELDAGRLLDSVVGDDDSPAETRPEADSLADHALDSLMRAVGRMLRLVDSDRAVLTATPSLLLSGDAGIGKTHLLCDIVSTRLGDGQPTVILLGNRFGPGDPWKQIADQLQLDCSGDELLGALEAAGEANSSRSLIVIDALNESQDRTMWRGCLAGMIKATANYPSVGLAVSVRSSYVEQVIPTHVRDGGVVTVEHRGFSGVEFNATREFFQYYGLDQPRSPLLLPEFRNPLFLKTLCRGLQAQGATVVPTGLRGFSAIIDMFTKVLNDRVSSEERLDADPTADVVPRAMRAIAEAMARSGEPWIERTRAAEITDKILPRQGYENSLMRQLLSEDVLTQDMFYSEKTKGFVEGVRFAYERFGDHMIAELLLTTCLTLTGPRGTPIVTDPLRSLLSGEAKLQQNQGVVEELCTQTPELMGVELPSLTPVLRKSRSVRAAFLRSLVWRARDAFSEEAEIYFHDEVLADETLRHDVYDVLLAVAPDPDHPYNADYLHGLLTAMPMPERDATWSILTHRYHRLGGAMERLLQWSRGKIDTQVPDEKTVRLCAIALGWLLTSSNRHVRDDATKGLVRILTPKIELVAQLLELFRSVDDIYVTERLLAAAYGCALRSTETEKVSDLARVVFTEFFEEGPPPHILLRDYARGVIERAMHINPALELDLARARPPYRSSWPSFDVPTEEELAGFGDTRTYVSDVEWAKYHLYQSVMGREDFSRYIIGTNSGFFPWSCERIIASLEWSPEPTTESFVHKLTERQRDAWDEYRKELLAAKQRGGWPLPGSDSAESPLDRRRSALRRGMRRRKRRVFDTYVERRTEYEFLGRGFCGFDLALAQRWILARVLQLGWTVARFGRFDRTMTRYGDLGRSSHKPERIGKKYQWIAYHELLARVSDNFHLSESHRDRGDSVYEGPWQVGERDIDPSCLLRKTGEEVWGTSPTRWWCPVAPNMDIWELPAHEWLQTVDDVPDPSCFIEALDVGDGSEWLALTGRYRWQEKTPPGLDEYEEARKQLRLQVDAYLVRLADVDVLQEWGSGRHLLGIGLPQPRHLLEVFLGEVYWSPAFTYHNSAYHEQPEWTRGHDDSLPRPVKIASDSYLNEGAGYDCSVDDSIRIPFPCAELAGILGLCWSAEGGGYADSSGSVVVRSPASTEGGPSALLVRRAAVEPRLAEEGYGLVWVVRGEKNHLGGSHDADSHPGRTEICGIYSHASGELRGELHKKLIIFPHD